jgi:hypothetical protein
LPKIDLYSLQKPTNETLMIDALQSEGFRQGYERIHGEALDVQQAVLTESILPFLNQPLVLDLLQKEDLACLPLVFAEGKLYCKGRFPTHSEWETLLNIGISIQE